MNLAFFSLGKFTMEIDPELFLLGLSNHPKLLPYLFPPFAGWQAFPLISHYILQVNFRV